MDSIKYNDCYNSEIGYLDMESEVPDVSLTMDVSSEMMSVESRVSRTLTCLKLFTYKVKRTFQFSTSIQYITLCIIDRRILSPHRHEVF